MRKDRADRAGFQHPGRHARPLTSRKIALAELIMTVTLMLSIAVAATAISIGIARAGPVSTFTEDVDGSLTLAMLFALFFLTLAGVTAAMARRAGHNPCG